VAVALVTVCAWIALAAAEALSATADKASGSCNIAIAFPGSATHFAVDRADPFGRPGKLSGAEYVARDRSLLLQYSCFKAADNRLFRPERDGAIQAFFDYSRSLGTFGQSYFYKRVQDAVLFVVSGERTINGVRYLVKWENHFIPYQTITVMVSYRADDRANARRAQEFIDSFRNRTSGSG